MATPMWELFKAGASWEGQLELKGSGTEEAPIQVNKYGEGANPAIHGKGEKLHTLLLHNVEYWEIRNLEITNTGDERIAGRRGVIVRAEDFGDCHHIILDSLEIHHVNGSLVKSDGGGGAILWQNRGDSVKTRFVGLQITNCHLHHCGRNGINSRGYTNRKEWHPSVEVVIRNNLLEEIPGDGIVPIGTDGALIEYNVMRDCPDILSHQEAGPGVLTIQLFSIMKFQDIRPNGMDRDLIPIGIVRIQLFSTITAMIITADSCWFVTTATMCTPTEISAQ